MGAFRQFLIETKKLIDLPSETSFPSHSMMNDDSGDTYYHYSTSIDKRIAKGDNGSIEHVPLKHIEATQSHLRDAEENIHSQPSFGKLDKHPVFAKINGKYALMDGHHRAEIAYQKGDTHIKGHVFNFDKEK